MRNVTKSEWRHGWHLVGLTMLGLICAPTTVAPYTIGLFIAPLQAEFGWSRGAIQGAILFSTGLGLIGGPLAGWLVKRFGLRSAILHGIAGIAVAIGSASLVGGSIWQFYLTYALIALLGAGTSAVTWSLLIAERFSSSRGLALGLALSGTGISAILAPRLAAIGLDFGSWRTAYLMLAAFPLLIVLPTALFLLPGNSASRSSGKRETAMSTSDVPLARALRSRLFWLMGTSTAAVYLAVGGLIPNLVPALTDRGITRTDAVTLMGILGGAIIVGRIGVGALIDRFWAPAIAAIVLLPAAGACLLIMTHTSFAGYAVAACLLGAATGMEFDMLAFLAARYFGLGDYARIYGRLHMFVAASAGGAPLSFGIMYDYTHSYDGAFLASALLLTAGTAGLLALGRYPTEKRYQILPSASRTA